MADACPLLVIGGSLVIKTTHYIKYEHVPHHFVMVWNIFTFSTLMMVYI
jgi:hypothetical protein